MVSPKPDGTERFPQRMGLRDIRIYLSDQNMIHPDPGGFVLLIKTVIMIPFLLCFPDSNNSNQFLWEFPYEFKRSGEEGR
jgi:hypothetical protein